MTRLFFASLTLAFLLVGTTACKSLGPDPVPYLCESGKILEAQYPTDEAVFVRYDGKRTRMMRMPSDTGTIYASSGLQWETAGTGPGSEGKLYHRKGGEADGPAIDTCVERH